ncbi:hypothetical protein [Aneurinibacillus danicus]|uniref:hypothetical protein n=1 Tax=Aneurinibacillus danicus TaxID=267746 RepID=UPI0011BEDD33|nr:hypothetical protein [Aneurinibacillus danicus]
MFLAFSFHNLGELSSSTLTGQRTEGTSEGVILPSSPNLVHHAVFLSKNYTHWGERTPNYIVINLKVTICYDILKQFEVPSLRHSFSLSSVYCPAPHVQGLPYFIIHYQEEKNTTPSLHW